MLVNSRNMHLEEAEDVVGLRLPAGNVIDDT
jgi:hypothetical protein